MQGRTENTQATRARMRGFITAALVYGLYGLLAEMLVEAWVRGAGVRGLATLVLLLYAGFTAAYWKRLGDEAKAGASLLVVLLLEALSAWQLGSADAPRALIVFGIPASALIAVFVLGALSGSAVLLLQLPWQSRPPRVVILALCLYAALPVVIGLATHRGFKATAGGELFLPWIPHWISGPVLGLFVLVLGVLTAFYRMVGLVKRGQIVPAGRWAFAATAMALCLIMAVPDTLGGGAGPLPGGPAGSAPLSIPSPASWRAAAAAAPARATLTKRSVPDLIHRMTELARAMRWARYNVPTRAKTLAPGVDPAFLFVRDHIRYEAYSGVLRGAEGAYIARAGNALDRSLLLAELLRLKGINTRFVVGRLARPQAETLFARIFEPAKPLEPDAVGSAPSDPDAALFLARLRTRASRDYAVIRTALGSTLPAAESPSHEDVLKTIETHVWIRAQVDGRWVDLDPAFSDASPGRSYTAADATYDAVPQDLNQQVTTRVVVESLSGGVLQKHTALEYRVPAVSLIDRQIFLVHVPSASTGLQGGIAGGIKAAGGGEAWIPLLWMEGAAVAGEAVAFNDQAQTERQGGPPSGGLGGIFGPGGALGGAQQQFVAEWLEFEISLPDGTRETTRRALVDRAGAAWRQSAAHDARSLHPLLRDDQGLTAPRRLYNIWLSAGRHHLAGYVEAARLLTYLFHKDAAQAATPQPSTNVTLWAVAMQLFPILLWSDHVIIPSLNDSPDYRFYPDSPRIMIIAVGSETAGGHARISLEYDLRQDGLRGVERRPAARAAVAAHKIWFGALEGALEHEMAADYAEGWGTGASVTSTSNLLTSEGAVLLRTPADLRDPRITEETAAELTEALSHAHLLVVPRSVLRGGSGGWWEVGSTGDTQALLGGGAHGSGSSYSSGKTVRVPGQNQTTYQADVSDEGLARAKTAWQEAESQVESTANFKPVAESKKGAPEYFGMIALGISIVVVAAFSLGLLWGVTTIIDHYYFAPPAAEQSDSNPP